MISLAKVADPGGLRTIGVITKPDKLLQHGARSRKSFEKLAMNDVENREFKLGWYVLKNRDSQSPNYTTTDREADEKSFFAQPSWANFEDSGCLGAESLRRHLNAMIHERIARNLPAIIQETNREISNLKSELGKMGKERSDKQAKQVFLLDIAQRFQDLVHTSVNGAW